MICYTRSRIEEDRNMIGVRNKAIYVLVKRESGGSPERTRRCNKGVQFLM